MGGNSSNSMRHTEDQWLKQSVAAEKCEWQLHALLACAEWSEPISTRSVELSPQMTSRQPHHCIPTPTIATAHDCRSTQHRQGNVDDNPIGSTTASL